jgi:hypothetical protein
MRSYLYLMKRGVERFLSIHQVVVVTVVTSDLIHLYTAHNIGYPEQPTLGIAMDTNTVLCYDVLV